MLKPIRNIRFSSLYMYVHVRNSIRSQNIYVPLQVQGTSYLAMNTPKAFIIILILMYTYLYMYIYMSLKFPLNNTACPAVNK